MKHAILITSILGLTVTAAQANWWEKGAEALKNIDADTVKQVTTAVGGNSTASVSQFSNQELEKAFREALSVGAKTVVSNLSQTNAFNNDSNIHIPLPSSLNKAKKALDTFGAGGVMADLETKLNHAAEAATPKAKDLFIKAIQNISFEDIQAIYKGSPDAATQFLKRSTSTDLKKEMMPIISNSLSQVGAVQTYDSAVSSYKQKYPFLPDVKADLQDHVADKAVEGIFYYVAQEEAAIRKDPVKRTTELLKKVFSN